MAWPIGFTMLSFHIPEVLQILYRGEGGEDMESGGYPPSPNTPLIGETSTSPIIPHGKRIEIPFFFFFLLTNKWLFWILNR